MDRGVVKNGNWNLIYHYHGCPGVSTFRLSIICRLSHDGRQAGIFQLAKKDGILKECKKMILKKDLETIMSTPELWQAFHDLEKAYTARRNGPEEYARYKAAFQVFRSQVEGQKGKIIPF